uniref:Testis-expressed sequence 2 protein-like n=1 Tax=Sinocyclocheilus rhinocerous TaxID=307959 RepID=A0A673IMM3_9TELE
MAKVQGDKSDVVEEKTPAVGDRPEAVGTSEEPKRVHTEPVLYLFGRTGRDKEEWFRRMLLASKLKSDAKKPSGLPTSKKFTNGPLFKSLVLSLRNIVLSLSAGCLSHSRSSSRGSLDEMFQSHPRQKDLDASLKQKVLEYNVYMAKYVSQSAGSPTTSPDQSAGSSPGIVKKFPASREQESESEAWVNALLGRIVWDFLGEKYWADVVSKKIQKKLSKIRLPYFMNELTLTELDMGISIPKILSSSKPSVDHRGLWFDLEISYNGSFLMTLETKMNLTRLGKKEGEGLGEQGKEGPRPRTYFLADSDEESSSAGSSDEEDAVEVPEIPGVEGYVGGHRPSKIMRFVDKIAKSKYFQKATETEFIKKKIEEVSNTPLLLTVEVQECRGTLAVNIPPPPTDRIWYGFRSPPHLELKARPKLGEREVTFAHVTDWIENKLNQEFQKIFVMPNMDDVWLPIMHSAMDTRSNANIYYHPPVQHPFIQKNN